MRKLITICAVLAGMSVAAYCEPRVIVERVAATRTLSVVHRRSADVYVALGRERPIHTLGCTVTARGLAAIIEGPTTDGRPFLIFLDGNGEEEGRCELDIGKRRIRTAPPTEHGTIRRRIATVR